MASVNIQDNITSITSRIESLKTDITRLEGSLLVFQQLKDAGATYIKLGNQSDILESKEVVDSIPDRRGSELETID